MLRHVVVLNKHFGENNGKQSYDQQEAVALFLTAIMSIPAFFEAPSAESL